MLLKKILEREKASHKSSKYNIEHRIKDLEQVSITAKKIIKDVDFDSPTLSKDLLNQIYHNLKTPLTPIKGYTDMLLLEKFGNLNETQKQKILQISVNIKQLEKNIEKFF